MMSSLQLKPTGREAFGLMVPPAPTQKSSAAWRFRSMPAGEGSQLLADEEGAGSLGMRSGGQPVLLDQLGGGRLGGKAELAR